MKELRRLLTMIFSLLVLLVIASLLCSCYGIDTVVDEIYEGSGYMTIEEAKQCVIEMLGENADLYEIGVYEELVRFSLKKDIYEINETEGLHLSISLEDGTAITLPCAYSNVSALGWNAEENINNNWGIGEISCRNSQGQKIYLTRVVDPNSYSSKIKDQTIEGLRVSCGDFWSKENYVRIRKSHPNFSYMGINRESTPQDVIRNIALPNTIEHNGINMYFEYIEYNVQGRTTTVKICWLALANGPKIMRDIKIRSF